MRHSSHGRRVNAPRLTGARSRTVGGLRPARYEGTDVRETGPGDPRKASKLRVLIVDDDARVRRALRGLIECAPDLMVVGEATM